MNILFACDIDNTLVCSYKKKQDGYICVELNKGREQGFMTRFTYENFADMVSSVNFVPVTSRSVEQYNRIRFPLGFMPEYALVSNGATLIHNSKVCKDWNLIKRTDEFKSRLGAIHDRYHEDSRFIRCSIVDEAYVYVYCADDTDAEATARELSDVADFRVELSGRKIYFFPDGLNKGEAVRRLNEVIRSDSIISAGDSLMDLPMLNIADRAFVPSGFDTSLITHSNVTVADSSVFSDFIIRYLLS